VVRSGEVSVGAYTYLKEKERKIMPRTTLLFMLEGILHCCDHPHFPIKVKKGRYKRITLKDLIKEDI